MCLYSFEKGLWSFCVPVKEEMKQAQTELSNMETFICCDDYVVIFLISSYTKKQMEYIGKWCPEVESNHRHKDFQSFALPTELSGQIRFGDCIQIIDSKKECFTL